MIDVKALGENTIVLDCDVLQADGGTRTAAITGAYVALADAVAWAERKGMVRAAAQVLTDSVAAVSVGIIDGVPMLDLPYVEDVRAETDMNVVVTGAASSSRCRARPSRTPFDRASSTRCSTSPWAAPRSSHVSGSGSRAGRGVGRAGERDGRGPPRPRDAQPAQGGELRAILLPVVAGLAPDDVVGAADLGTPAARGRRHLRRERPDQGTCPRGETGLPAVADDSGLCVDVLGGAPGDLLRAVDRPAR